jgi:hypothetical protein
MNEMKRLKKEKGQTSARICIITIEGLWVKVVAETVGG